MNEGDLAVEHGDLVEAEAAYGAAQEILGDNLEAAYWYAIALCNAGEIDRAVEVFHEVFAQGENWRELTPRLIAGGFLVADEATLERILDMEDQ
jgi:pentatricopeptide repeat protein